MELRQYGAVIRRHWPLVAAVVALTALVSLALVFLQRPVYTATTRLALRQQTLPAQPSAPGQAGLYTFDRYYAFYSAEFLAEDYALLVPSRAFANRVVAKLAQAGTRAEAGVVQGALTADQKHRELNIAAATGDPALSVAIATAVDAVFTDMSGDAGTQPTTNGVAVHDNALFAVVDPPAGAGSNRSRLLLNAGISTGAGLALALALAFLLEYLDNRLRDLADTEQTLGLPVLGAIPGGR